MERPGFCSASGEVSRWKVARTGLEAAQDGVRLLAGSQGAAFGAVQVIGGQVDGLGFEVGGDLVEHNLALDAVEALLVKVVEQEEDMGIERPAGGSEDAEEPLGEDIE
jgi:hypothetical protein